MNNGVHGLSGQTMEISLRIEPVDFWLEKRSQDRLRGRLASSAACVPIQAVAP
jgi:hypothetical protein